MRNLIIAPITEELVFREFFIKILHHGGYGSRSAGFVAPIIFAIAHVHHHYKQMSFSAAVMAVGHTCIFGWIASVFLLRRSVWDAIISHSICNFIGLSSVIQKETLFGGAIAFLVSLYFI